MVPIPSDNGVPDLSNREILKVLMQEIADVRGELKQDIADVRSELKQDIAGVEGRLQRQISTLDIKMNALTVKVDQNFLCFMSNVDELGMRVTVLETK